MISEFFLTLATGFMGWLADVFGPWEPPEYLLGLADVLADGFELFASVGVWVEWTVIGICVGIATATWAVVFGIKLVRALVAHVPVVGGAGD